MKNKFKKTIIGALMLALTTVYGGMLPVSATTDTTTATTLSDDTYVYNGHSYKLFDTSMDWNSAQQYCESLGGHLVTINSADEQQFVSTIASKSSKKNVWLGATKGENGKFSWVTGEDAQFSNWSAGEPSNYDDTENAVMMYTYSNSLVNLGEWNDIASTGGTVDGFKLDDIGFICEWESTTENTVTDVTGYQLDENGNIVTDDDGEPVVTNQQGYIIVNEESTTSESQSELSISVITPETSIITTADTIGASEQVTTITDTSNQNIRYLYNGHTYQIFENMNLSWNNAKAYCTALGGHLVTITDANEQTFINAIIKDNSKPNLWIGAERNMDGSYSWVTGEEFSYNNWINGIEVNYATEFDVSVVVQTYDTNEEMLTGTWSDISKEGGLASGYSIQEIGFICEWDEALEGAYELSDMGIDIDLPEEDTSDSESNPIIRYIIIGTLVVAIIVFMIVTSLPKKEEK
ncbi:MAG: C-type lectin domain-containing protein [Ruminococcus sp.]|nr:C-type lectin domain-containing protein [Ruminococcus sp.]